MAFPLPQFTGLGGGSRQLAPVQDWQARLAQLYQQQQAAPAGGGGGSDIGGGGGAPIGGGAPQPASLGGQPIGTGINVTGGVGGGGAITSGATQTGGAGRTSSVPAPGGTTATSQNAIQNAGGTSRSADASRPSIPGKFFSDIATTELGTLLNDPRAAAALYGKFMGSPGAIQQSLGNYADPEALMRAMGYQTIWGDPQQQLSKQQDIWGKVLGVGSGENYRVNNTSLIQNILNAARGLGTMDQVPQGGTGLGNYLYTASGGNARALPQAVNQMIAATMFGNLSENTRGSLQFMLDQLAQEYEQMWMREPAGQHPNYVDFITQRLGPSLGGIFA